MNHELNIEASSSRLRQEFKEAHGYEPGPHARQAIKARAMTLAFQSVDLDEDDAKMKQEPATARTR